MHDGTTIAFEFAAAAGAHPDDVKRIAVTVEELLTNLYEHGGIKNDERVSMELFVTSSEFSLVLTDPGRPFDPRTDAGENQIAPRGGGAGLKLVRAWASEIEYTSSPAKNRLSLRIPRRAMG
ncbi:ATP-binding protein [Sphingomonas lutea]|uniref:ATP-binding protein n=1 Tax=Sphingomonas lutea TaxID=1045317 RepID=A0A7G9SJ66_9SPHN|nr:ATP-binding protein [Sphingomonas lutea]QNN67891.1 ATP-binding protein [Sphingomonas lutea]